MRNKVLFTLLIAVGSALTVQAQQYGWPPPNYSVTGVRASDGYHYRNLRQVLHDHGYIGPVHRWRARKVGLDAWQEGGLRAAQLLSPMTTLPPPTEGPNLLVMPRPSPPGPPEPMLGPEQAPPPEPDRAPEEEHAGSTGR